MNRVVRLSMSLALMAFPFVACLLAEPNDEGDIRQVVSRFAETWNHHDMEAVGRLFAGRRFCQRTRELVERQGGHPDASCVFAWNDSC